MQNKEWNIWYVVTMVCKINKVTFGNTKYFFLV